MRKLRLAGLLLAVTLLAGACGQREQAGQAPGRPPGMSATSLAVPPAGTPDKPCLHGVEAVRPFWFRTSAGAMLVGLVVGHGRTGLVLAHGRGGDLCEWLPRARGLAEQGYRALAFDFEGFGDSRPGAGADARLDTDVVAAAQELRRRGADRIVLIGSSMGGTAVLVAATRIRPPVAGVVSLSGPAAFGAVNAWRAMPRLRVPVLFVTAADDEPFLGAARGDVPQGQGGRQAAADRGPRPRLRHPGLPGPGAEGAGRRAELHRRPDPALSPAAVASRQVATGLAGGPCYRSGWPRRAAGVEGARPMTWIIIALIFAAAAAAGFRIQALTRDEPPEPALNHRWRAMGGGQPSPQSPPAWRGGPGGG